MLNYLKIKVTSLAAEAKIIRNEERKQLKQARNCLRQACGENDRYQIWSDRHYKIFFGLQQHRKLDVRQESRWSNIAYGFLKGRKYNQIEKVSHNRNTNPPNWDRIWTLIKKYGEGDADEMRTRFVEWKS
jgi:hypothetical protein